MPKTAKALIDASIIYGAMRFYHRVHDDFGSPLRGLYRKSDDHLLFLEMLHHILLYDQVVLESSNSHLDLWLSAELGGFIDIVNSHFLEGSAPLGAIQVGSAALQGTTESVQQGVCELIRDRLDEKIISVNKIKKIRMPHLYKGKRHHDYASLCCACRKFGLPPEVIPFSLFVWRGFLYSAIARHWARSQDQRVAYVAAPGRLVALRAILEKNGPNGDDGEKIANAERIAEFKLPREALRKINAVLPDLCADGYQFSDVSPGPEFSGSPAFPAIRTSSLTGLLWKLEPDQALKEVGKLRSKRLRHPMRVNWIDLLFEDTSTCVVGSTYIQIVKNANIQGDLILMQKTYIRAKPTDKSPPESWRATMTSKQTMKNVKSGGKVVQRSNVAAEQLMDGIDAAGDVRQLIDIAEGHLATIAAELAKLRLEIQRSDPSAAAELRRLKNAEAAAQAGNGGGVMESLQGSARWVSDFATKIGTSVVAKLIEKQMGF